MTDTKHRAASLRQLSFLNYLTRLKNMVFFAAINDKKAVIREQMT